MKILFVEIVFFFVKKRVIGAKGDAGGWTI